MKRIVANDAVQLQLDGLHPSPLELTRLSGIRVLMRRRHERTEVNLVTRKFVRRCCAGD